MKIKTAKEMANQGRIHNIVQRGAFTYVGVKVKYGIRWLFGSGFAKCNCRDEYSEIRGLEIALGRARKDLAQQIMLLSEADEKV